MKIYPDMEAGMGRQGVFVFFTVMSLLGTLFVIFFLPETKGKTLREIEDMFSKKKKGKEEEKTVNWKEEREKMIDLKNPVYEQA